MLKLIQINKDRRYKLTLKQISAIKSLKNKYTQEKIAIKYNISRQRVSQIFQTEEAKQIKSQKDARITMKKYREDENYRNKLLQRKKDYYEYKVKTIKA